MHLERTFTFKTTGRENPGEEFGRILPVLKQAGWDEANLYLRIENPTDLKSSAMSRVLRAFPQLVPYHFFAKRFSHDESDTEFISTLPEGYDISRPAGMSGTPLTIALVRELLNGIPKRFPLWSISVLYDDIPVFDLRGPDWSPGFRHGMLGCGARPNFLLESHWGKPRRRLSLVANLPTLAPPPKTKELALPSATSETLRCLGRIASTHSLRWRSAAEVAQHHQKMERTQELRKRFAAKALAADPTWIFPVTLPSDQSASNWLAQNVWPESESRISSHAPPGVPLFERAHAQIPSIKLLLEKYFRPLHFRYSAKESGRGTYMLRKPSQNGNLIAVSVDVSPTMGQWHASLSLSQMDHFISLPIPVGPWGDAYPINQFIEGVVTNAAWAVARMETTVLEEIDEDFGIAPSWMSNLDKFPKSK